MDAINSKLPSFTLIETIVSLAVILLAIGLSATILIQVQASGKQHLRFKANIALNRIYIDTINRNRTFDEIHKYNGFIIEKKIIQEINRPFFTLQIIAYDQNKYKVIEKREEIIWIKNQ
ncbi:MAG: hypothetical protein HJHJAOHD_02099 [Flavobacteriales bacterium]|nr:hypothetical protein [Flavobacteriales bacterium]